MSSFIENNCAKNKTKPLAWFRFYTEALDDPKVQRLAPHLFKAWVNLLCLAGQNSGQLPSIDDIAFRLRLSAQDAEQQISDLILAGLIDITSTGRAPHNWAKRQFVSDHSTERVRKHREIRHETTCNVSETADETPPEQIQSRTDTEAEAEQILVVADAPKPKRKGTRLPEDWELPDDWRDWTRTNCPTSTSESLQREATKFANYWIAKPTAATKLDWFKTWQNWCLNNFATGPVRPNAQPPPRKSARDYLLEMAAAEGSA
jgi:hypothetical protein